MHLAPINTSNAQLRSKQAKQEGPVKCGQWLGALVKPLRSLFGAEHYGEGPLSSLMVTEPHIAMALATAGRVFPSNEILVTVVGCGLIGLEIAGELLRRGCYVRVYDADQAVRDRASQKLQERLKEHHARGLLLSSDLAVIAGRCKVVDSLEAAVADSRVVIEAVPENLELKRSVFARIASACTNAGAPTDEVLLCTTSASLDPTSVGAGLEGACAKFAARLVGLRFLLPCWFIDEVVVNVGTTAADPTPLPPDRANTVAMLDAFLRRLLLRSRSRPLDTRCLHDDEARLYRLRQHSQCAAARTMSEAAAQTRSLTAWREIDVGATSQSGSESGVRSPAVPSIAPSIATVLAPVPASSPEADLRPEPIAPSPVEDLRPQPVAPSPSAAPGAPLGREGERAGGGPGGAWAVGARAPSGYAVLEEPEVADAEVNVQAPGYASLPLSDAAGSLSSSELSFGHVDRGAEACSGVTDSASDDAPSLPDAPPPPDEHNSLHFHPSNSSLGANGAGMGASSLSASALQALDASPVSSQTAPLLAITGRLRALSTSPASFHMPSPSPIPGRHLNPANSASIAHSFWPSHLQRATLDLGHLDSMGVGAEALERLNTFVWPLYAPKGPPTTCAAAMITSMEQALSRNAARADAGAGQHAAMAEHDKKARRWIHALIGAANMAGAARLSREASVLEKAPDLTGVEELRATLEKSRKAMAQWAQARNYLLTTRGFVHTTVLFR